MTPATLQKLKNELKQLDRCKYRSATLDVIDYVAYIHVINRKQEIFTLQVGLNWMLEPSIAKHIHALNVGEYKDRGLTYYEDGERIYIYAGHEIPKDTP